MLAIQNTSTEPYFNQATEDNLLKNVEEDIFMLWQNDNAIVIGKHQNTLAEINMETVNEKKIKVVRRLTGGGAVFHDLGNLNFTFIMNYDDAQPEIDFKKYTRPIIGVMAELGIEAAFSGRNDILIDGQKFSGNAEHIFHQKKRVLHHGTLLFNSQISDLSAALKVNPLKFEDKAVKSVRSRVTNISSHLKEPISVEEFRDKVMAYIVSIYSDVKPYELTQTDKKAIQQLADEKYSQWQWNYGYSPKYSFQKEIKTKAGIFEIYLEVDKGLIQVIKISGNLFTKQDREELESALIGKEHRSEVILKNLKNIPNSAYFNTISEEELLGAFF